MTDDLKELLIPAAISVPFFIFGFATAANLLEMSLHDLALGAFGGSVCGVTALMIVLFKDRKHDQPAEAA